jgi:hypothetical protein
MGSVAIAVVIGVTSLVIVAWIAGAIYYDLVGASNAGAISAIAWAAIALVAIILWQPIWKPFVVLLVVLACFAAWWLSQRPSQNRAWDPHFASVARMTMDGDDVTIANVRHSEYLGPGQATPRYETRRYRLSELRGADVLVLTWGAAWMSHPMFIFDFGPEGRVCFSIEVRYRAGQRFSILRSLYRQQEVMCVVSDERDAILRRTKFMLNHDLYLYRLQADDLALRRFFLEYAGTVNALADQPRWYHGLTANCTTIVYAQGREHIPWHWRMVLNGALDKLLYDRQLLDQSLPFPRLKELSWVNDVANRAPAEGFGNYVREHLKGYRGASQLTTIGFGAQDEAADPLPRGRS